MVLRLVRGDRGSAAVAILPVVIAAMALTLALVVGLGGAGQHRRSATTAADAAALAAAQYWRDQISTAYAIDTADASTIPAFADRALGDLYDGGDRRAAELARANGAEVEVVEFVPARAEVHVTTTTSRVVFGENQVFRASAVARIELREGACRSGGSLGLMLEECVTSSAELEGLGLTPGDVASLKAEVRLVR